MRFSLFGQEFEVTLPSDPAAFVKGHVIKLLNYMGYEWPTTDTGVLDAWASDWDNLGGQLQSYVTNLESGITHLSQANEGEMVNSVVGYLNSGDASTHSLSTLVEAAPAAAMAYRAASKLVTALRAYVIGQILLDVVSIACAIITGGASAAVSILAKKGAKLAINLAIDQAINALLGA